MIKVMSFNIRYGLAEDGVNHWQHRKTLALARIQDFQPDLLGLQECRDDAQADFIRDSLTDYQFYGVHRLGSGGTNLEMAPALFKKSAFEVLDQGCFWISTTPHLPGSKSWDSDFPRTCTWFKLRQRTSKQTLIFLNTHFDYKPQSVQESPRVLQAWISENAAAQPLILSGDFNAAKDSQAYRQLTESAQLFDTYPNSNGTFHQFGQLKSAWPIDWILASAHFKVIDSAIDDYHESELYPSDHYPLIAILDWKD